MFLKDKSPICSPSQHQATEENTHTLYLSLSNLKVKTDVEKFPYPMARVS